MSLMLSVYERDAFREFLLPAVDNADYEVILPKDVFGLDEDYELKLEILGGVWRLRQGEYRGKALLDGEVLRIPAGGRSLSVLVREVSGRIHSYRKYRLGDRETVTVGKGAENDICYDFRNLVSRRHAVIRGEGGAFRILSMGKNGLYVNGRKAESESVLEFGAHIHILGLHLVFLGNVLAVNADRCGAVVSSRLKELLYLADTGEAPMPVQGEQRKVFHRSPRSFRTWKEGEIRIELPPQEIPAERPSWWMAAGPSLTMALPMVMGSLLMAYSSGSGGGAQAFLYSGLIMSLSSALISAGWALGGARSRRKQMEQESSRRQEAYAGYLAEKRAEIERAYACAAGLLREMYPGADVCLDYGRNSPQLWSRNADHADFLSHRLGLGDRESPVRLSVPEETFANRSQMEQPRRLQEQYRMLHGVPILLHLKDHGMAGIVGGEGRAGAVRAARALSVQIAACCCYTDVKMAFLYDCRRPGSRENWDYARWLPHVWSEDRKTRYMAGTPRERSEVSYELAKSFRQGEERPYVILFVEEPELLEGELLAGYVLGKERCQGLTTIFLAERREELPNACRLILENTDVFRGMYEVADQEEDRRRIAFDAVDDGGLERFARRLSGIRVREDKKGGEIPETLTFLEMLGVHAPDEIPVAELWAKNRTWDHIRGMIGQKAGGEPVYLDLHEKYHGPHGLLAGTTGSGKSETLQTLLLSLAVNYSPDDLAFLIIDYKGGGMANLFQGLPHLAGQISNLSGNQIRRAMISIKSENRRRQRIFARCGVNHIDAYTRLYKNGEVSLPVPHLLLVIDEFAELKREEPDFMAELISVAQVGRSLGVHLILSTQKPGGTVDENIWSNARFRICLRVQDRQDSMEMLHRADAAVLTQTGRGYLQVGNDEIYELFQSGYSGALYEEGAEGRRELARMLRLDGRNALEGVTEQLARPGECPEKGSEKMAARKETTQLAAVRDLLAEEAERSSHHYRLRLWKPPLGRHIFVDDLAKCSPKPGAERGKKESLEIILGQADDPENQSQLLLTADLLRDGHMAVCGGAGSGKSTFLQTALYGFVRRYPPENVWIYGLDLGDGMLSAFAEAPHVGGILCEKDEDKLPRFFHMLGRMAEERRKRLAGGTFEQRNRQPGDNFPAILIFVDNYETFREKTEDRYEAEILRICREGRSCGIYLILSGNGAGIHGIPGRILDHMGRVFCLELPDPYAYGELLRRSRTEILPERGVRGRGLAICGGPVLEFQTALALEAGSDYERMEQIRARCREMQDIFLTGLPERIPEIPEKPVWSVFCNSGDFREKAKDAGLLPVGYDRESGEVYALSLQELFCYCICGASGSGKTNFLKIGILSALEKESKVCIADSAEGELRRFSQDQRVRYARGKADVSALMPEIFAELQKREKKKRELIEQERDREEIFREMSREIPWFIFIADLEELIHASGEIPDRELLEGILAAGGLHHMYLLGVLDPGISGRLAGCRSYELFTGYGTGIHLGGRAGDDPVLDFGYMSYEERNKREKPGVGSVPEDGTGRGRARVVIPKAEHHRR